MKRIFLASALLIIGFYCSAQNNPFGQVALGANAGDNFFYNGNTVGHYSLGWYYDQISQQIPPSLYMASFQGIKFFTEGAPKMYLNRNGNLGIGSANPTSRLTVSTEGGESQGSFLFIDNSNASFGGSSSLVGIRTTGGSGNHYNFFKLQNVDGTKFLINGAGEVAIGSGETRGYKLAVNGTIRAQEIKVESGPWPDYVFKPDYKLPTLTEVENYINKNGHLPKMPTAKEVEKEGVSLGETNRLLLQKLEEVTLYLIELKNENTALKAKQLKQAIQLKQISKRLFHLRANK